MSANYVPALPAKKFNGVSVQQVGKQFCLVFEWTDGKNLKPGEINTDHCIIMGSILSSLHTGDFSDLGIMLNSSEEREPTNWNFYLYKGQQSNAEWTGLLLQNIEMLYDWSAEAINSAKQISSDMVISHGDLDPKNVLWDDKPVLIDWECAGYRNPKQDLIETAIYWSESESGEINKDKFLSFIDGYKGTTQDQIHANWRMILASGFLGKLDWLEYSLKRSLWIDCTDQDEQKAGTEQVAGTILAIKRYAEEINKIEEWLKGI